jgi:hypothetical protein
VGSIAIHITGSVCNGGRDEVIFLEEIPSSVSLRVCRSNSELLVFPACCFSEKVFAALPLTLRESLGFPTCLKLFAAPPLEA